MAWVKLHTDILGDPKLMRATRKGARHLVLLPWIIAFAKHADDDGRLTVNSEPAEPDDIAQLIPGATRTQVKNCLEELKSIGVLVEDGSVLTFSRWDVRAGRASDSKDATRERKRQQRLRSKGHGDVTRDTPVTSRNGHALEKEKEEEKEKEVEKRGPPAAAVGRQNWVTELAEDWRRNRRGRPPIGTIGK